MDETASSALKAAVNDIKHSRNKNEFKKMIRDASASQIENQYIANSFMTSVFDKMPFGIPSMVTTS